MHIFDYSFLRDDLLSLAAGCQPDDSGSGAWQDGVRR